MSHHENDGIYAGSSEVDRLRAENEELRTELERLRKEVEGLREQLRVTHRTYMGLRVRA